MGATNTAPGYTASQQEPICYNCGSRSHWVMACPEPTRDVPAGLRRWRSKHLDQKTTPSAHSQEKKGPVVTRYTLPTQGLSLPPPPSIAQYGPPLIPYPPAPLHSGLFHGSPPRLFPPPPYTHPYSPGPPYTSLPLSFSQYSASTPPTSPPPPFSQTNGHHAPPAYALPASYPPRACYHQPPAGIVPYPTHGYPRQPYPHSPPPPPGVHPLRYQPGALPHSPYPSPPSQALPSGLPLPVIVNGAYPPVAHWGTPPAPAFFDPVASRHNRGGHARDSRSKWRNTKAHKDRALSRTHSPLRYGQHQGPPQVGQAPVKNTSPSVVAEPVAISSPPVRFKEERKEEAKQEGTEEGIEEEKEDETEEGTEEGKEEGKEESQAESQEEIQEESQEEEQDEGKAEENDGEWHVDSEADLKVVFAEREMKPADPVGVLLSAQYTGDSPIPPAPDGKCIKSAFFSPENRVEFGISVRDSSSWKTPRDDSVFRSYSDMVLRRYSESKHDYPSYETTAPLLPSMATKMPARYRLEASARCPTHERKSPGSPIKNLGKDLQWPSPRHGRSRASSSCWLNQESEEDSRYSGAHFKRRLEGEARQDDRGRKRTRLSLSPRLEPDPFLRKSPPASEMKAVGTAWSPQADERNGYCHGDDHCRKHSQPNRSPYSRSARHDSGYQSGQSHDRYPSKKHPCYERDSRLSQRSHHKCVSRSRSRSPSRLRQSTISKSRDGRSERERNESPLTLMEARLLGLVGSEVDEDAEFDYRHPRPPSLPPSRKSLKKPVRKAKVSAAYGYVTFTAY